MKKLLSVLLVLALVITLCGAVSGKVYAEGPDGGTSGGSTDGGSTGGNPDGGSTGGSTDGGNTDGGSTGGNTDGGNTDGGSTGGNTDGGNTDGGNTDGGNTDGGNTDGGNTDGGNTDGGNTDDPDGGNTGDPDDSGDTGDGDEDEETEEKPELKITKDPTGETVRVGKSAIFIARAENAEKIVWYVEKAGGSPSYNATDAPSYFYGLRVDGQGTERLTLSNIPLTMDGWVVKAVFIAADGTSVSSKGAKLTVFNAELVEPKILSEPKDETLEYGESITLSVTAEINGSGKMIYQWYKNTKNSNTGGRSISGATESTYTPDYIEGTTYYYCAIRNSSGNDVSVAAKTRPAAITYAAKVVETTAPPTTVPPTTAPTEPELPTETVPVTVAKPHKDHTVGIVIGVLITVAVIGCCATVLILKFYQPVEKKQPKYIRRKQTEEYVEVEEEADLSDFDEVYDDQ